MNKALKIFLTIILSLSISLIIIELSLRIYVNLDSKVYEIEMMKYAMKLKKIETYQGEKFLMHKPNKKNISIMGSKISTDAKGSRISSISASDKLPKIIILGDSMTFGFGSKITFSDILQKRFKDEFKIYNAGIGNTNTIMQVNYFFYNFKELNSKFVVLNFYINDLEQINLNRKNFFTKNFYLYNFVDYRLKILKLKKNNNYVNFYKKTFLNKKIKLKTFEKIYQLKSFCDKNNINFVINIIPDLRDPKNYSFRKEENELKEFLKTNNINFIENLFLFLDEKPENYWVSKSDPHPNEIAHELLSIKLEEYIEKKK